MTTGVSAPSVPVDALAETYYARLSADYAAKIRALVPRYDDMADLLIGLLRALQPRRVLDLGAGVGLLTRQIVRALPSAHVTALDASRPMVDAARELLGDYADQVTLVRQNAETYRPAVRYDAVVSNLVLHNLSPVTKADVLRAAVGWLAPGGTMLWGDLIRFEDSALQAYFVAERIAYARAAGCEEPLIAENFDKEGRDDHPLKTAEMAAFAHAAGFSDVTLVWAHDTFAVLHLRAPDVTVQPDSPA